MTHTSALCRAQEREQLARAAETKLENVRIIAERAAKAWADEAASIEKAELKRADQLRARADGEAVVQNADSEDAHIAWLSENPTSAKGG